MTSINVARNDGARTVSAADARSCVNVLADIRSWRSLLAPLATPRFPAAWRMLLLMSNSFCSRSATSASSSEAKHRRDLLPERGEMRAASCVPFRSDRGDWRAGRADAGAAPPGRAGTAGRSGAPARSAGSRGSRPTRPASCPPAAPAAPAHPTAPASCRARGRTGRCRCASSEPRRRAGTGSLVASALVASSAYYKHAYYLALLGLSAGLPCGAPSGGITVLISSP